MLKVDRVTAPREVNGHKTYAADYIAADTRSKIFLDNPHIDNLLSVVFALGAEIWSDRKRARITELLLERHGKVTREMVEKYQPSAEEEAAWQAEREAMVTRVYAVLSRDTSDDKPFETPHRFHQQEG